MDKKIEKHESNLKGFIDIAIRWSLEAIYTTKTPHRPFSMLTDYVPMANVYFDDFRNQLRLEIDKPENGKAFEIDIKDRFLKDINRYYSWYDKNALEIEKLWGHPNLYSMMLDVMKSTEREINKYYSPQTEITKKENKHSEFNPNLWSKNCYELFKYLYDNYYKGTKKQLTNIWFYLKEYNPQKYTLKATKEKYIVFIKEEYSVEIKNFDKSLTKYNEKEYPTMNEHRINFETTLS